MASPMDTGVGDPGPGSPDIPDRIVTAKGEDEEARLRRKLLSKRSSDSTSAPAPQPHQPQPQPHRHRAQQPSKKHKRSRHSPIRHPDAAVAAAAATANRTAPSRRVALEEEEEGEGFSVQPITQQKERTRKSHKHGREHRHKRDSLDKDRLSPPPPPPPPSRREGKDHGSRRNLPTPHRDADDRSRSSSSRRDVPRSDSRSRRQPPPPPPPPASLTHSYERGTSRGRSSPRRDERRGSSSSRRESQDSRPPRREEREELPRDSSDPHVPRSPPLPPSLARGPAPDSGSSPGTSSSGSGTESGELSAEEGERRRPDHRTSPRANAEERRGAEEEGVEGGDADTLENMAANEPEEETRFRKLKSKFESSSESEAEEEPLAPLAEEAGPTGAGILSPEPKDVAGLIDELEKEESEPEAAQEEAAAGAETVAETEEAEEEVEAGVVPTRLLPVYYAGISGCRSVEEFHCLNRIEEGTYGVVYRAKEKRTDEVVALKRLKMEKEKEGFPITSLREINMLLKAGGHPNVVNIREIVVGTNMDKIYLCMDYVEHDMKTLMESMKQPFLIGEVKTLLYQLLAGIHHLHDNWILHRDLKTSNLLLSHKGDLKIGDFGLAREYGSPIKPYTPIVVTLWYRAPELLLGTKEYSTPIDLWYPCFPSPLPLLYPFFLTSFRCPGPWAASSPSSSPSSPSSPGAESWTS